VSGFPSGTDVEEDNSIQITLTRITLSEKNKWSFEDTSNKSEDSTKQKQVYSH
jgi:hypothetical protein